MKIFIEYSEYISILLLILYETYCCHIRRLKFTNVELNLQSNKGVVDVSVLEEDEEITGYGR